jgi:hypothetical protein
MKRLVLLLAVLASVALQPPAESSLGTMPTPPVVGIAGATGAEVAPAVDETSLVKYAITQGGLAVVLLIVFWSYRRDLGRIELRDQEKLQIVVTLVEKNTAAQVTLEQTSARLARAIETQRVLPPGPG